MRAAFYETTGPAREVLRVGELPDPVPGAGEVRVRLHWSGVNPSDVKSRAGLRSKTLAFPRIVPHSDGMGVIDAVGDGVDPARIGERVWIWNAAWGRAFGTAAELVALPSAQAVRLPDATDGAAAACFGIPAQTALHAVLMSGGVRGQRVLVAGGAGAVGHYAIQFARLQGARQVLATVSGPAKADHARAAGVDVCIDYKRENVVERVRELTGGEGVDRVIEVDMAGNAALDAELLKPDALCVVYGSSAGTMTLPFFPYIAKNLRVHCFIVYNLGAADRARVLAEMEAAQAKLRHAVALRLPLERIAEAHEAVESGQVIGNVVIDLRA
ncbi:MAG TPA: NADPH:quinone reductase [Burkholderiaceae bacterium]|nr:NADPH:quinone reductase [Burkholderiaceae bacterium]